ncbi:hypothetical protein ABPG72_009173 [Tetrahymena utriculariae]
MNPIGILSQIPFRTLMFTKAISGITTILVQLCNIFQNLQQNQLEQIQQFFQNHVNNEDQHQYPLQLYINNQRQLNNQYNRINQLLSNQQILKIQRCASSLWDYFPSGIISFVSMIFTNQCVRHEYILIYTQNYVVSAEISSSKDCRNPNCLFKNKKLHPNSKPSRCKQCRQTLGNATQQACIQVMIYNATSHQQQQIIYEQYQTRYCSRVIGNFSFEDNTISQNFSFARLLMLWTLILIIYKVNANQENFYHLIRRNCKTFARSSFYFLQRNFNINTIFESIFALYIDTPGYFFEPFQGGLFILSKNFVLSKYQQEVQQIKNYIQQIIDFNIQMN